MKYSILIFDINFWLWKLTLKWVIILDIDDQLVYQMMAIAQITSQINQMKVFNITNSKI